jgi:hypothetical protein
MVPRDVASLRTEILLLLPRRATILLKRFQCLQGLGNPGSVYLAIPRFQRILIRLCDHDTARNRKRGVEGRSRFFRQIPLFPRLHSLVRYV